MIHPVAALFTRETDARAGRLKLALLVAAFAALCAVVPTSAGANVTNSVTQTFGSNVPGAHGDYTIEQTFTGYSGVPTGAPGVSGDDLKQWIAESPVGFVGNPNAIPAASRCDLSTFENAMANPSTTVWFTLCGGYVGSPAQVGDAELELGVDASGASAATLSGKIFILSTNPEVPTKLGTIFPTSAPPSGTTATYSLSTITPLSNGDFRLQTVSHAPITRPIVAAGPTYGHIKRIKYHLFGSVNGVPFLTNPTRCDDWISYAYAQAYDSNSNADSDPIGQGPNTFVKATTAPVTPDCSTLPAFAPSASVNFSTTERNSNPQIDFTVNGITNLGDDYPKKVVTTLPASVTTDIQGIASPCEITQRDTNSCPASTKVGTATVTTPLLVGGLTGDVYMIRGADGKATPDLSIFFNNPPNPIPSFRMDGITKFVGPKGNQIETTFDNGPQNPFTSFKLTIFGGTADKPDSLLTISACPDKAASPEDGPITFSITGFSGQSATTAVTPALKDCFGIGKLKKIRRCVKSILKVSPSYQSRGELQKVELWIKRKGTRKYSKVKTLKKSPFRFKVKLSSKKYRPGTHRYKIRAVYKPSETTPTPTVVQRFSKFKKC